MAATLQAPAKLSREEVRRQRDLQEARKLGNAPAEVDEKGNVINPHIPEFMAKAPWYMDTGAGPSLSHTKGPEYDPSPSKLNARYDRGQRAEVATRFRKGACSNCGAMTHKREDCLERPRKKGAKYTGQDFAPDEYLQERTESRGVAYDSKRDRWDGYDPTMHLSVVAEHEALEEARKALREKEIDSKSAKTDLNEVKKVAKAGKSKKKKALEDEEFGSSDESDEEDELKYADAADVAGQKLDTKNRVTVRNLRIREDTAKYLINLDTESAYYDPKTRSMRENPSVGVAPEDAVFAGENFTRHSGGAAEVQRLQMFAWQSEARGQDVHINANPTQASLVHQQFKTKKDDLKDRTAKSMLDKYGGTEFLQKPPKELLSGQTEEYIEYSRTGQVIKGVERAKARSKYDEDVHPGNHTSVWGSWFSRSAFTWGYACCHSTLKASYCAGQAGIEAEKQESAGLLLTGTVAPQQKTMLQLHQEKRARPDDEADDGAGSKRRAGDMNSSKLDKALRAEQERLKRTGDEASGDAYNRNIEPEDMEAYRRLRSNAEDPMANLANDQLLPM
ncbi:uncharacterized protein L969DRAFT_94771 [Mixia osmundae IAM 14324]|uniref:Pre-mRNA-splicing factor SLU7 n=1 Tax=Mixia osmundae (strain CBS 9802 / IAM 14324 / JCM 22182 / KY 12970) TaxID=764103 RepID=G7E470_MIXOS|nr:uncharacterized protein L969DRAFT_94771 [Mixia osmundae IAM 14324]KEI39726.1 hypothetical protein L969DRAFT_94771 [Mixia osmundae IAM 14324]GAA97630.1 hypothetical protein E5Q_04308 [Mixia osmundae IAM 14324]